MIHYQGLVIETHPEIPQPSPSTYLLLENLEMKRSDEVLEVCTGTGMIAVYCAQRSRRAVATTKHPPAINCALKNMIINRTYNAELKPGKLFEPVQGEKFDLILFNALPWEAKAAIRDEFTLEVKNYLQKEGRVQILDSINFQKQTRTKLEESGFEVQLKEDDSAVLLTATLKN